MLGAVWETIARIWLRGVLALFYAVASGFHLTTPGPFLRITPRGAPYPEAMIAVTGMAELLGAAALLIWLALWTGGVTEWPFSEATVPEVPTSPCRPPHR